MKPTPTTDKLRGGYYTPPEIARFLAEWAIRSAQDDVLEPSCGDGAILKAAATRLASLSGRRRTRLGTLTGIELHSREAAKAEERASSICPEGSEFKILRGDFFSHALKWGLAEPLFSTQVSFDAVVGNPPFIRYQHFPEEQRSRAFHIMHQFGLNPNKLTNAWVPFLVASTVLLKEGGRLGMVIPAELLQVNYAAEVRQFLSRFAGQVTLVTFRKLVFSAVQQDVVLLLAERLPTRAPAIRVVELDDLDCLADGERLLDRAARKRLLRSREKWTRYFLNSKQIGLLRRIEEANAAKPLRDFADVDVGVVTGENSFFALCEEDVRHWDLGGHVIPLVTRSAQVQGLIFSEGDWREVMRKQDRVFLFNPPDVDRDLLPQNVRAYIDHGEALAANQGYKCRIRKRWYIVPSQWKPDAFGLRQVHEFPRLILNQADATATDTLHRVRFTNGVAPERVAAAMVNSLTLASSEVLGRSYGGGVLTFEPSEFESLPVPHPTNLSDLDFVSIDRLTRAGNVQEALAITDDLLLRDGLGLDRRDINVLRTAWNVLRERRHGRNRGKKGNVKAKSLCEVLPT